MLGAVNGTTESVGINEKIINKFKDCKINYYERYIMKV
jgi:hypothetical protein